ncbi:MULTISPECIES: S8 family serine peptidase, partial [unclassified Myroides]|uniref:S8 family serine peptidase n=1 Tax=unclassified Myroides TaxID=2642485 RepID=UPI003D2F9A24
MNKRIVSLFSFLMLCGWSVTAQNQVQKNKITTSYKERIAIDKKRERLKSYILEKQKAIALAKDSNITLGGVTKEGRMYSLQRVDEFGNYIYYITHNEGSRITAKVNDVAAGGSLGLNLDGRGVTVGVWDGASALTTHVEFGDGKGASRVLAKDNIPNVAALDRSDLNQFVRGYSHSTHVIGTIAARGISANARGMAPEAVVVSYNWDNDANEMSEEAETNGLLVSNHSYGMAAIDENGRVLAPEYYFGSYDYTAMLYDWLAHTYKYYQPVVAAGNDQRDFRKVNPTKNGADMLLGNTVSKNVIVVGAVRQVSNYTGPGSVRLADFSSQGPSNDFRIKPDITAKGVDVYSSYYRLPSPISSSPRIDVYSSIGGTSMAAPAVTGIIALWQQWAMENREMPLKSATIRALLVHTADEAGIAPGPDHQFGWGLINAKAGVQVLLGNLQGEAVMEEGELKQGETLEREFTVQEGGGKFIATLTWTDPEGEFSRRNFDEDYVLHNPSLVNDLDLRVYKDGEEFFPWKLNKDFNNLVALKGDNDVDNVEKIEIDAAEAGTYTIVVSHKGTLEEGKQEYSLLISTGDFDTLSTEEFKIDESLFAVWPNPVMETLN